MNTTTSSPKTVEQLKKEYENHSTACKKYRLANCIHDLTGADSTYLKLLIKRNKAELEYRKAAGQNIHLPRIRHQLQRYRTLLSLIGVIV